MKLLSWLAIVTGFCCAFANGADRIRIKGSDTMLYLNEEWARAYERTKPGARIEVTGGGSELGLQALLEGTVELAATSRPIKSMERQRIVQALGSAPREFAVALDGIGIYVHPDNPIPKLTLEQVRRLFAGELREWDRLYPFNSQVEVFSRNRDSGTHTFFVEHVLSGKEVGQEAKMVANTAVLIEFVKRKRGAIGYGGLGYAEGVKTVPLVGDGGGAPVTPSVRTISDGSYPISRTLYLYGNPVVWTTSVRDFMAWVLGDQGQRLVADQNYIPLPQERVERMLELAGR